MPIAPPTRNINLPPSARACQVMDLRASGLTLQQVAARLGLSRSTVGVYLQICCEYLGVHGSRRASALWRGRQARPAPGQHDAPCDLVTERV
jgi:DNA-binding CsgD family transcriptional regulator